MKYIITILLSVCFYCSFGQQIQYTPMTAAGYQFKYGKFDSGLAIPFIDTFISRGTLRPGSLVCRPQDTLFYMFNGFNWNVQGADVAALVAKINTKVDSVIVHSDTLNYWINGVSYGQVLPALIGLGIQSAINVDSNIVRNSTINLNSNSLIYYQGNIGIGTFESPPNAPLVVHGTASVDNLELSGLLGSTGQVPTRQSDNSIAWQTPPGATHALTKIVGTGSGPVAGNSTYTNTALIGLPSNIQIFLADYPLSNYGLYAAFTFDNTTGTIDISPNTFTNATMLYINLNQ